MKKGGQMKFISEVYWDRGGRGLNEDSVSLQEVRIRGEKVVFALVCDGIGGLADGERASGFVAERMTEWFYREALMMIKRHKGKKKIERSGLRALYRCNEEMSCFGEEKNIKFGTTAVALLLKGRHYFLWHSGDGRAYWIKGGWFGRKIKRLTQDHVLENGMLIRCIGSFSWKKPDVKRGVVFGKGVFLLCSDGFRNRITEEKIGEALLPEQLFTRGQISRRLKEIAEYVKKNGEQDNISAIVIRR